MKPLTILFDVDGVLADFVLGFTKLAGLTPYSTTEQLSWDFDIDPKLIKDTLNWITTYPGWWSWLDPLASEDEFRAINHLSKNHHVVFGTNRKGVPSVQEQTAVWLESMGIRYPNVVVTKKKGELARLIDADFAIDDKPENAACIHWIAENCKSYIKDHPYNRVDYLPKGVKRVVTVSDFLADIMDKIERKEKE